MSSVFKFKQFSVNQSGCAMKINTDGVLLAAIVHHLPARQILDVGTGTGVIALMLAQRFPDAAVDAVEIDTSAAQAAGDNFRNSVFSERVKVYCADIIDYRPEKQYDMIVSNPPYFVNDLKNTEKRKQIARHANENFFDSLLARASRLLTENGSLWLILPVKQAQWVVQCARQYGLVLSEQINVCSDKNKPVIRHIFCLKNSEGVEVKTGNFYIYSSEGIYTDSYKALLKDFFLAF